MIERETAKPLGERVSDLEITVKWLTDELGLLSERLTQATRVEEIIRRSQQNGLDAHAS